MSKKSDSLTNCRLLVLDEFLVLGVQQIVVPFTMSLSMPKSKYMGFYSWVNLASNYK